MGTWSKLKNKQKPLSEGVPYNGEIKIVDESEMSRKRAIRGNPLPRTSGIQGFSTSRRRRRQRSRALVGCERAMQATSMKMIPFIIRIASRPDHCVGSYIAPTEVEMTVWGTRSEGCRRVDWPDEYRGETVKAFVVADEQKEIVTEQDNIEFCRSNSHPSVPTT